MTLLNWELTADQVLIFSDTLSINGDDKRPRNFMTKIYPLPDLAGVVTGTGLGRLVTGFFLHVTEEMVIEDVAQLSTFAPEVLQDLWADIAYAAPDGATATVYTFGLAGSGEFVGFAYRSINDFSAEPLPYAIGLKPAPASTPPQIGSLGDFVELALLQQAEDRVRPRAERVGIGGDLWLYVLARTASGRLSIRTEHLLRLPHHDADREMMLAQLPANRFDPQSIALLETDGD